MAHKTPSPAAAGGRGGGGAAASAALILSLHTAFRRSEFDDVASIIGAREAAAAAEIAALKSLIANLQPAAATPAATPAAANKLKELDSSLRAEKERYIELEFESVAAMAAANKYKKISDELREEVDRDGEEIEMWRAKEKLLAEKYGGLREEVRRKEREVQSKFAELLVENQDFRLGKQRAVEEADEWKRKCAEAVEEAEDWKRKYENVDAQAMKLFEENAVLKRKGGGVVDEVLDLSSDGEGSDSVLPAVRLDGTLGLDENVDPMVESSEEEEDCEANILGGDGNAPGFVSVGNEGNEVSGGKGMEGRDVDSAVASREDDRVPLVRVQDKGKDKVLFGEDSGARQGHETPIDIRSEDDDDEDDRRPILQLRKRKSGVILRTPEPSAPKVMREVVSLFDKKKTAPDPYAPRISQVASLIEKKKTAPVPSSPKIMSQFASPIEKKKTAPGPSGPKIMNRGTGSYSHQQLQKRRKILTPVTVYDVRGL